MTAPIPPARRGGHALRGLVPPLLLNAALGLASDLLLHDWLGWTAPGREAWPAWLGNGLPFLQFMAVAFLVDRVLRVVAERLRGPASGGRAIPKLGVQLLSVLVYFAFLGSSVSVVFGESVSAVLAASGIVGLAVGFAVRGLLSDVFSGIALHLDASVRAGDWIDLILRGQPVSGRLVDIQWRTVVIADRSNNHVFIPNSEFATATIVNRSQPGAASEYSATLPIAARQDRARVVQVLDNALARAVGAGIVLADPAPYVRVGGLDGEGALSYRLFYCLDPSRVSPSRGQHEVMSHAIDFLKAANLTLQTARATEIRRPASPGERRVTETAARLSVLSDVPLLSVLSRQELADLAAHSAVRYLSDGQAVMQAGEGGASMVVVAEGRLAVSVGGRRVATLWPGECAGEMSLLTGSPRSADVAADGPACLLEVDKQALTGILQANPSLVERMAAMVDKRMGAADSPAAGTDRRAGGNDESGTLIAKIRKFFRLAG